MTTRTITRYRSGPSDRRLGRHVNHDSKSRSFAFPTAGLPIVSAKHTRRVPILDQGNVGACTGFAGIGCLGTDPFAATPAPLLSARGKLTEDEVEELRAKFVAAQSAPGAARPLLFTGAPFEVTGRTPTYSLDEAGALALYGDATRADDYPGEYPPTDSGSDGLTIGKVLKAAGEISGYQWTFSLDAALRALGVTPFITGTDWMTGMFDPDPDGRVRITGSVEGGHEYVADEIDAERQRVWFSNSWGTSFGVGGRFYITFDDYGELLDRRGDVTIFVPLSQPPPTPTPVLPDPADAALALALRPWAWQRHCGANRRAALAGQRWLTAKGL